jgi:hypothetical protein
MSILLVYTELPNLHPDMQVPSEFAAFPIKVNVRQKPAVRDGLIITDGVASDRFLAFSHDTRGKEGAKLRAPLISFIRSRLMSDARVFLWFNVFDSRAVKVSLDFDDLKNSSIGQLRQALGKLELGQVLEVVK